ncbi:MAG: hypothetical protein WBV06_20880 [Acidimicrobiia bacterium]
MEASALVAVVSAGADVTDEVLPDELGTPVDTDPPPHAATDSTTPATNDLRHIDIPPFDVTSPIGGSHEPPGIAQMMRQDPDARRAAWG